MAERGERSKKLKLFSFLCPEDKEEEARDAIQENKLGRIGPKGPKGKWAFLDETGQRSGVVDAVRIEGVADIAKAEKITQELSNRGIAGYSKQTQVIFHSEDE